MVKERIAYLDNLRALSIFAIILIHVSLLWTKPELIGINIHDFFINLGRIGVPIFLMISGALLLNKDYSNLGSFYKRRFPRIVLPFILWILVYVVVRAYVAWPKGDLVYFVVDSILNNFMAWYFYLILGIYFALPFINDFIRARPLKDVKYFVILFLFASVFYSICNYTGMTSYFDLRFFLGGMSYLILGYYLSNVEIKYPNRVMILSILIFIICFVLRYQNWDLFSLVVPNNVLSLNSFLDVSITQIGLSASVFMFFKLLYSDDVNVIFKGFKSFLNISPIKKFTLSISKASYGMYLSHIVFFYLISKHGLPSGGGIKVVAMLLATTIAIFLITWIITLILSKIPYLKAFSGFH